MKVVLSARNFKDRYERRRYIRAKMKKQRSRKSNQIEQLAGGEIIEREESYLGKLQDTINDKTLRIYFQNVNTMGLGRKVGETETALQVLDAADVALVYLTEVNKNPEHKLVQLQLDTMMRRRMKEAKYEIGSNGGYKPKGIRKPGSMMAITARRVQQYVVDQESDKRGRWMKTRVKIGQAKVAVYSIYVPQSTDGGGCTTVRRQLQNGLDEEGIVMERTKHLYKELGEAI